MRKYSPTVSRLLHIKERFYWGTEWPDYPSKYGLGPEHIPELIHMATDENLYDSSSDMNAEGCLHARRALAQLKAVEAAQPLLRLFITQSGDEGLAEEFPLLYGMIGEGAIPALEGFISDTTLLSEWQSMPCACLRMIGEMNPDALPACVDAFLRILDNYEENSPDINGMVITELIVLDAKETFPAICRVFEQDCVDEMVVDGNDVLEWMEMDAIQAPSLAVSRRKNVVKGKQLPSLFSVTLKMQGMDNSAEGLLDTVGEMAEQIMMEGEGFPEIGYSGGKKSGSKAVHPKKATKKKAARKAKK